MKSIFIFCFLALIITACVKKQSQHTGAFILWQEMTDSSCGNFLFGKNDTLYIPRHSKHRNFNINLADGLIVDTTSNTKFKKKILENKLRETNKIKVASYIEEVYGSMFGELYNLLINESIWSVDIYWPQEMKGSYQFKVDNDEMELTLHLMKVLIENLDENYYPAAEDQVVPGWHANALYISIGDIEYFGVTGYASCELLMIHQWVVFIIEKYLSPEYKINDDIIHVNIRERFNEYAAKDEVTGADLLDFEEVLKEIEEFSGNNE